MRYRIMDQNTCCYKSKRKERSKKIYCGMNILFPTDLLAQKQQSVSVCLCNRETKHLNIGQV